MLRVRTLALTVAVLLGAAVSPSYAHWGVRIGFGFPIYFGSYYPYYRPYPYYYPAYPVVVAPAPVVVQPVPAVQAVPAYQGYSPPAAEEAAPNASARCARPTSAGA